MASVAPPNMSLLPTAMPVSMQPDAVAGLSAMPVISNTLPQEQMMPPGHSLPSMPQPPFLQANGQPTQPMQTTTYVIPGVFDGKPGVPQMIPPAYQTAQSVPVQPLPPIAEVPRPELVSPWLYHRHPMYTQPAMMTGGYPYLSSPGPVYGANMPNNAQSVNKGPSSQITDIKLTDELVRSINDRLNSVDKGTRTSAAVDLIKLLEQKPSLSVEPASKKYIDAFIVKILRDPTSTVRFYGITAIKNGLVQNPSEAIVAQLKAVEKNPNPLVKEREQVWDVLEGIKNNSIPPATPFVPNPNAKAGEANSQITNRSILDMNDPINNTSSLNTTNGWLTPGRDTLNQLPEYRPPLNPNMPLPLFLPPTGWSPSGLHIPHSIVTPNGYHSPLTGGMAPTQVNMVPGQRLNIQEGQPT